MVKFQSEIQNTISVNERQGNTVLSLSIVNFLFNISHENWKQNIVRCSCICPIGLRQGFPTCGTRTTSGT